MPERQCPVCDALVDENKAFCPECGSPMEKEEKRDVLPDIGSMTKTFNLSADEYQQMLREMNLSTKPEDNFQKTQSIVISPEARQEAKAAREIKTIAPIVEKPVIEKKKSSGKLFYILLGLVIFLTLTIAAALVLFYVFRQEIFDQIK